MNEIHQYLKSFMGNDPRDIEVEHVGDVWSDEFSEIMSCFIWKEHLIWLSECGWEDAFRLEEVPDMKGDPKHEVVSMLYRFVKRTGWVNAHFGLTSSDVVDNVRLIQAERSIDLIEDKIDEVVDFLNELHSVQETTAFTHLRPASKISWSHRACGWISLLVDSVNSSSRPKIYAKKFGGSVGDSRVLNTFIPNTRLVEFDWTKFGLDCPNNHFPIQSSDHQCEYDYIIWICKIAANLHKIANDLRNLHSIGSIDIVPPSDYKGSSSMPHKINPIGLERTCSICMHLSINLLRIWNVLAHNELERTLNTSWTIKRTLKYATQDLCKAIDSMIEYDIEIRDCPRSPENSEMELAKRVFENKDSSRWAEYISSFNKDNNE